MTSRQIQSAVLKVLPKIIEQASPLRVLLFGSAVRNLGGDVNDLDFLVVVPDHDRPSEVVDRLNVGVRRKPMPCDFLVATPSMLAKLGNRPGSVYTVALAEGRELYAR